MQIFDLPKKSTLAHMDCQFFANEAKRGVAAFVIKVQYRTKRGKPQHFIIPLSDDIYRITRVAKETLGADASKTAKQRCKDLKEAGLKFYCGYRQVSWTEKSKNNGTLYKKLRDGQTQCWAIADTDGSLLVTISWAGEMINVVIAPHKTERTHVNQSYGIGYYDKKDELKQQLKEKFNGNDNAETPEAPVMDSQERREVSGSDHGSQTSISTDELVGIAGDRKADQLRSCDTPQVVDQAKQETKPARSFKRATTISSTKPVGKRDKRSMVDSDEWGAWQPEPVSPTANGIGLTLRF